MTKDIQVTDAIVVAGGTGSSTTQPPSIDSFSPTSGAPNDTVTVNGKHLAQASSVTFSGTPALFTVVSAQQINATVLSGAMSGPIAVSGSNGTATSASSFTVNAPPAQGPSIDSFSPTSG